MMYYSENALMDMLKALADDSRLTLIKLLNEGEHTVTDLAELLNLGEPTISHHLSRLRENGLVNLRMAGNQRFYRVNETGLERFKRLVMDIEKKTPLTQAVESDHDWINALGWDAADQKVLRDYTQGRQLVRLPSKRGKTQVILRWLATLFEPERLYNEAEVNEIIKAVYVEDFVSLRRDLIDMGYLRREMGGGKYWRTPADGGDAVQAKG
jgi:predicted transcriptional regulator